MTNQQALIPPVIWAQRNNVIYVTICVEDCKNPTINIEPEQIYFKGIAGLQQKVYEVTVPLYSAVEPENSKTVLDGRYIELVLQKPTSDFKYWPHLTKEKKKLHWLKVDFKKWKDEDDSDDEMGTGGGSLGGDNNIDDMLNMMGGGPGGPKFGGMGGMGGLGGDFNDGSEEDSDDDEMPDLDDVESGENGGKGKENKEEKLPDLEEVKPATTA